jgi:hypothetical protein
MTLNAISRRNFIQAGAAASAASVIPATALAKAAVLPSKAAEDIIAANTIKTRPYIWHVSLDGGYIYNEKCDSREEAVAIAQKYHGGATIAECQYQDYCIDLDSETIFDMLRERNEELIGEGEFIDCTTKQANDLGAMVSEAIANWVEKHNIDITAWQFGDTRNQENIPEMPEQIAHRNRLFSSIAMKTLAR